MAAVAAESAEVIITNPDKQRVVNNKHNIDYS